MRRRTFLRARLHVGRLRELAAARKLLAKHTPIVAMLAHCPQCTAAYFTVLPSEAEAGAVESDRQAAQVRLADECPDHAHQFSVGWP